MGIRFTPDENMELKGSRRRRPIVPPKKSTNITGWIVGILFFLGLGGVGIVFWINSHKGNQVKEERQAGAKTFVENEYAIYGPDADEVARKAAGLDSTREDSK